MGSSQGGMATCSMRHPLHQGSPGNGRAGKLPGERRRMWHSLALQHAAMLIRAVPDSLKIVSDQAFCSAGTACCWAQY